ncbi:MAG: FAD-binding protein [Cytophagales bacterium]|nr:MAG: FAD-binding protein [Cytophagales bacterium]TAF61479.1 MAG: FAD-binding protein [Cytophagales bacterium]
MTAFKKIEEEDLRFFTQLLGQIHTHTSPEKLAICAKDETEDFMYMPEVVLCPATAFEVSQIMRYCSTHLIPVTPRGGGTGLSGGALPVHGGVVLSMERFNKILDIDTVNLQATVEPGVVTEVFQKAVMEKGLFYPPDPASKGSCFLGGNLAECSGGPKAVKYGVTRDYVLNIEMVTAQGDIFWTGANVLKNSTGYNLTQLMIGSEGTLGIITKIVFKLRPLPTKSLVLLVPFYSSEMACRAISSIYLAGIVPSGMEFMEHDAINITSAYLEEKLKSKSVVPHQEGIEAHLIIELDGNKDEELLQNAELIHEVLADYEIGEILLAQDHTHKEELWKLRRQISPALNAFSHTKSEDLVVPRSQLPNLILKIKAIAKLYGFRAVCYGHAGDGNLHVNILKESLSDAYWQHEVPKAMREMFAACIALGGTLSGEHGIGWAKREFMPMAMPEIKLTIMRGIKQVFDPKGILNPSKIF